MWTLRNHAEVDMRPEVKVRDLEDQYLDVEGL